ncbi:MAG: pyridoxamine 5'-phosphate oxidase family protein [Acetobacteraceae bacterium]|nr:pyridoxamine 5'-phosphate oxidase family protein [Acetobacteraceae bacterium]
MLGAALTETEAEEWRVARLLATASATIAKVPICWVVTPAEGGHDANARAVRDCTGQRGDPWTRWFLARPGSRKMAEIRRTGRATIAYQHGSGNAYVTLCGRAAVVDDRAEVEARLGRVVDDPDGSFAARLVAVRVEADRVEVHVRGITAEPWGQGRTLLQRDEDGGAWRLLPD